MKFKTFGPLSTAVSVIGQGTWNMEMLSSKHFSQVINRGLDYGMTHIDTAEMYGDGRVEILLGKAILHQRDKVFLVSKILPSHASQKQTVQACERSLRRLQTDYLDCYLLHWLGSYPLEETIAAFEALQKAGKIRSWGMSNIDEYAMARTLEIPSSARMTCNQVLYHLKERAIEHAVLPFCEKHTVALVAYSPFGSGRFPSAGCQEGRVLSAIAKRYSATPRQIALAFLIRHPSVFAIPKASKISHVEENALAAQIVLSDTDIEQIKQTFPLGARREGIPTL